MGRNQGVSFSLIRGQPAHTAVLSCKWQQRTVRLPLLEVALCCSCDRPTTNLTSNVKFAGRESIFQLGELENDQALNPKSLPVGWKQKLQYKLNTMVLQYCCSTEKTQKLVQILPVGLTKEVSLPLNFTGIALSLPGATQLKVVGQLYWKEWYCLASLVHQHNGLDPVCHVPSKPLRWEDRSSCISHHGVREAQHTRKTKLIYFLGTYLGCLPSRHSSLFRLQWAVQGWQQTPQAPWLFLRKSSSRSL